jgi:hypothetical protein
VSGGIWAAIVFVAVMLAALFIFGLAWLFVLRVRFLRAGTTFFEVWVAQYSANAPRPGRPGELHLAEPDGQQQ